MTFLQIISSDGAVFNVTLAELSCSKLLKRIAGDLFLVTRIDLDNIDSEVMSDIHKFMKLYSNPPSENWVLDFLEDCSDISKLLQAAHFLEIDELTSIIAEIIAKQIMKCKTVEEVFFFFLRLTNA